MARLFLLFLLLTGCATVPAREARQSEPAYVWATFNREGILESGASGFADRARGRRLTISDPARIASVSKLVVALGVLRMVEQGRLDLDRDVSDYLGWRLRNPAYPDRPITLRLLLGHRSSLRDDVDYAIPLGTTLRVTLANPAAFDASHPPGGYFRYSNLNFPVIASVMERAGGERFNRLMERLVLRPLGLEACFNWTTCSDETIARAVVLTEPDGTVIRDDLGGRRPDCPVLAPTGCDLANYELGSNGALFSPQGGLRISVRDLVTVGMLLINGGPHRGGTFLESGTMRLLGDGAWTFDGRNGETENGFYCSYGLALQVIGEPGEGCNDGLFGPRRWLIGHAGDAYGVRSGLWIDTLGGTGIAYFAIGNGDDPPRGRSAYRAIEEQLAGHLPRSRLDR